VAFQFWSLVVGTSRTDVVDILKSVRNTEPFYRNALQHRIRCGDITAVGELIRMVESDSYPHFWWQDAYLIWNHTLRAALDSFLRRLSGDGLHGIWDWERHHFCAAQLLVEIPSADAEALLTMHWEHLKYKPVFVQATLAVATPRCCELVAEAVAICPDPPRLFEYFDYIGGFWARDRGKDFGPLQLEAIIPYLDLFSGNTIDRLWQWCNEQRQIPYRRQYLDSRLTPEQKARNSLGREALFQQLDRYVREGWTAHVVGWEVEFSQQRGESWNEFFEVLLAWMSERRNLAALGIVAHAVIAGGSRSDLEKVRQIDIEGDRLEAQRLLERTAFQLFRRRLQ
jgi:hypothetical protein